MVDVGYLPRFLARLTSRVSQITSPHRIPHRSALSSRSTADWPRRPGSASVPRQSTRVLAITRTWFRRLLAVVPFAWHYDPVFLRAAIGTGIALAMFLVCLTDPPSQHMQASPACGTSLAGSLAPVGNANCCRSRFQVSGSRQYIDWRHVGVSCDDGLLRSDRLGSSLVTRAPRRPCRAPRPRSPP